ncbi:MAG: hypothetical protein NTW45_11775 [Rhodocyclales bacterium]|nr:hypothetical protein [Rhodocyclales bacterium]
MKSSVILSAVAMTFCLTDAMAGLLVTEITGRAEIEGKGAVATLAEISDGSRLSLQADATIVAVDLANGKEYVLKGGQDYRVTPNGPQGIGGSVTGAELPAKGMPDIRIEPGMAAQAKPAARSMATGNVLNPISPVKTVVVSDAPLFRWTPVEASTGYRLSVLKPDGSLHWEARTRDTQLPLSKTHRLAPGEKYVWRIEYFSAGGATSGASAEFSVAPAATIKQLSALKVDASSPFSRRVLYAALLTEVGAKDEARELWKELAKEKPDDNVLRKFAEAR